ncbi:hypothetical protein FACS1894200_09360 [Spirochaetia bacterium]|nr:hypothetical protein FACS1894200_09360 [Spirochaetia bacterium]
MNTTETLNALAAERILILDGAMGSMIQSYRLTEADFRGSRFATHPTPLTGCNDLLCLTKPQVIASIHTAYLEAGADRGRQLRQSLLERTRQTTALSNATQWT